MATVFIDGQAGTTGLQITERLKVRPDIELVFLTEDQRKDSSHRRACLQEADVSILCLPDAAAIEAVTLAAGSGRLLDASTAHRVDPNWVYGLPELDANQRSSIQKAKNVSNPGCYPQGVILFMRPLIAQGIFDPATPLRVNALSGYSGGGRQMVESRQTFTVEEQDRLNCQTYGLSLDHKHVPEMQYYSGVQHRPIFSPTVAHYYQGMLVSIPLFAEELNGQSAKEIHTLLSDSYANERYINVLPQDQSMTDAGFLNPTATNGTNELQLMVFGDEDQILLVARYDNLGKGAAGAAVQNLNLMLGIDEGMSL